MKSAWVRRMVVWYGNAAFTKIGSCCGAVRPRRALEECQMKKRRPAASSLAVSFSLTLPTAAKAESKTERRSKDDAPTSGRAAAGRVFDLMSVRGGIA